jgi:hypothetical protein
MNYASLMTGGLSIFITIWWFIHQGDDVGAGQGVDDVANFVVHEEVSRDKGRTAGQDVHGHLPSHLDPPFVLCPWILLHEQQNWLRRQLPGLHLHHRLRHHLLHEVRKTGQLHETSHKGAEGGGRAKVDARQDGDKTSLTS